MIRRISTSFVAIAVVMLVTAGLETDAQSTSRIVFARPDSNPPHNSQIFIANDDGTNEVQLTNDTYENVEPKLCGGTSRLQPGKVVFASNRDGAFNIWVMNISGSGAATNLTPGLVSGAVGDRKPDCKLDGVTPVVVYRSDKDHFRGDIYKVSQGSAPIRLTNNDVYDADPSWCGADKIVFVHHDPLYPPGYQCHVPPHALPDERRRKIFLMKDNGTLLTQLTDSDFEEGEPSCSPDAADVAWTWRDWIDCQPGTSFHIARMPICAVGPCDHNTHIDLTPFGQVNKTPSWSPDGTKILFASSRSSQDPADFGSTDFDLYKMDALLGDGGPNFHNVTHNLVNDLTPDWNNSQP